MTEQLRNEPDSEPKSPLTRLQARAEQVVPGYEPGAALEYELPEAEAGPDALTCRIEPEVPIGDNVTAIFVERVSPVTGHEIGMSVPGGTSKHWTVDSGKGVGETDDVDGGTWVDSQLLQLAERMDLPDADRRFRVVPPRGAAA